MQGDRTGQVARGMPAGLCSFMQAWTLAPWSAPWDPSASSGSVPPPRTRPPAASPQGRPPSAAGCAPGRQIAHPGPGRGRVHRLHGRRAPPGTRAQFPRGCPSGTDRTAPASPSDSSATPAPGCRPRGRGGHHHLPGLGAPDRRRAGHQAGALRNDSRALTGTRSRQQLAPRLHRLRPGRGRRGPGAHRRGAGRQRGAACPAPVYGDRVLPAGHGADLGPGPGPARRYLPDYRARPRAAHDRAGSGPVGRRTAARRDRGPGGTASAGPGPAVTEHTRLRTRKDQGSAAPGGLPAARSSGILRGCLI